MNLDTQAISKKIKRPAQITPSLKADLEFAIINGEQTLPSKAKFYPTKILYVRGLRYKEQLEIAQINNNLEDKLLAWNSVIRVYQRCIELEGLTFENLLAEDFITLALWIVFLTNPEQIYQLQYLCKNCGKSADIDISPSQMELQDFTLFETQNVETELGTLQIAPITMQEFIAEQNITIDKLTEALLLGQHIKKVNGSVLDSLQDKLEVYGSLSPKEVKKVREIALKFKSGIIPIECVCNHCKHKAQITPTLDLLRGLP